MHGPNIACASAYGIVGGTTPSSFDPTAGLTRGQAAFAPVPAAAQADVVLRVVGQGGNGTADPSYRIMALQLT